MAKDAASQHQGKCCSLYAHFSRSGKRVFTEHGALFLNDMCRRVITGLRCIKEQWR